MRSRHIALLLLFAVSSIVAETPTGELVKQIAASVAQGKFPAAQMREAAERGGQTVAVAIPLLEKKQMRSHGPLCQLIADAARIRSAPKELLKLYDPTAHDLFYTEAGLATERQLTAALDWKQLPAQLPIAVVRAAPRATLAWLHTATDPVRIAWVLREWSRWIATGNERQHRGAFLVELKQLARRFPNNDRVLEAVLAGVGHAKGAGLLQLVIESTKHESVSIRAQACRSLSKLGWPVNRPALAALLSLMEREKDVTVLSRIGEALGAFPREPQSGAAALRLFKHTRSPVVRREILYATAKSQWQERGEILQAALRTPEAGVLSVAMAAVTRDSPKEVREQLVLLSKQFEDTSPDLVDALGRLGDARSVPYLQVRLRAEKRAVLRAKIVLALEQIKGAVVDRLIEERLISEPDREVRLQLVRVAARRKMESTLPLLLDLARDESAADDLRVEAIWGLGAFSSARGTLLALGQMKGTPSLYANLALTRMGDPKAKQKLFAHYESGTPTQRLIILVLLGEAGVDHPLIEHGLRSDEFAVLLGAVRAAGQVGDHQEQLNVVRSDPYVNSLLNTSLQDVHTLAFYLNRKK